MQLHHITNRAMITVVTAGLLLSGVISTVTARDRDGQRRIEPRDQNQRIEPRNEQRDQHQRVEQRGGQRDQHQPNYRHDNRQGNYQNHSSQVKTVIHRPSERIFHSLPAGYRTIRTGDRDYYYHQGVFYNRYNHGYEIVQAPRFYYLPHHARRVIVNRATYFVCDDIYYVPRGGYYEICEPPHFVESSIEFNAGPVKIILTDSDRCYH